MEVIDDATTDLIYQWYVEEFQRRDLDGAAYRNELGYAGTSLAPRLLGIVEFTQWLRADWRSTELKSAWLKSFIRQIPERLNALPFPVRHALDINPDDLRRASWSRNI